MIGIFDGPTQMMIAPIAATGQDRRRSHAGREARVSIRTRSPWVFVPTLYFAEGVPYILANSVSVIVYKRLDVDNATIALVTSWLYLPWVIKMLWGPLVDTRATKRQWILGTQLVLAISLLGVGAALGLPSFLPVSLAVFALMAFVSATHDVAADGFYLHALSPAQQAWFVGVRTMFYRAAMIFGSGLLVTLAGRFESRMSSVATAWATTFAVAGVVYALFWLWHCLVLPRPESDRPLARAAAAAAAAQSAAAQSAAGIVPESALRRWLAVFGAWFSQPRIAVVIAFILLYRLGEALLLKLAAPFLLDGREAADSASARSRWACRTAPWGWPAWCWGACRGAGSSRSSACAGCCGRWRWPSMCRTWRTSTWPTRSPARRWPSRSWPSSSWATAWAPRPSWWC